MFKDKTILITGGTGTFGTHIIMYLLQHEKDIKKIIVFSRCEYKQYLLRGKLQKYGLQKMRFFIGDVRDYDRLLEALRKVDIVIHTASLKRVEVIEYNPFEAINTNILGTQNLVRACIQQKVERVIALSTDKCVNPVNLYGATKLCLEKLIVTANVMGDTLFSVARYGNVFGSRGSVIEIFLRQLKENKPLTITHPDMTRFTITIQDAIQFVVTSLQDMKGGEIFIPILPSYTILQLTKVLSQKEPIIIGRRPGEKLHELMISENESHLAYKDTLHNRYILLQYEHHYTNEELKQFEKCKEGFFYSSNQTHIIHNDTLQNLIQSFQHSHES